MNMNMNRNTLPVISLSLILLVLLTAAAEPLGEFCNKNTTKLDPQSSYNLQKLLSELVTKTSSAGYSAASFGAGADQVHGLAECRGDVSTTDCSSCIRQAAGEITSRCPGLPDARIWYDYCFLRYNKDNFVGKLSSSYALFYYNVENVTDPDLFNKKLGELVGEIRSQAVKPESKGIGKGETKLSPFITLYALTQCTRDLSAIDCAQCLSIAVANFPTICNNKKGCRALYDGCYVRYELYPFFFPLDSTNSMRLAPRAATSVSVVIPS
ncbi:Cysteine-rich repeat secretory protein 55 [Linum grandiflorum]